MRRLRLPTAWTLLTLCWAVAAGVLWVGHIGTPWQFHLDWQPEVWRAQPWRLWTAAWVHWSGMHVLFNLMGCAALLAWGHAADVKLRHTLAWLLAWPLVQLALAATTSVPHYGGLSGVLHAGVAIGCWALVRQTDTPRRWVGAWVLLGLCLKVALEQPLVRHVLGWGDDPVPLIGAPGWYVESGAHLAGLVAGLACAALVDAAHLLRRVSPAAPDGRAASH